MNAEIGILGALMYADAAMMAEIRLQISADDFLDPSHGVVFGIVSDIVASGVTVDSVLVFQELKSRGLLAELMSILEHLSPG
jgi:replicative DNA helicase